MIDISDKTFANILQSMLLQVTLDVNKREGSLIRTSLAAAAWTIEGLYNELANVQLQAFGETATGEYLDLKAAERNLTRKPATAAVCEGEFNLAPTEGSRFAARDSDDNLVYVVTSPSRFQNSKYYADITCETTGAIGNSYTGALSPLEFIPGLTTANLVDVLSPGTDVETDEVFRERYKESLVEIAFGGNIASYREFVLAQPSVGAMMIFPTWNGPGTVRISIVDPEFNPCTSTVIAAIQNLVCPIDPETQDPSVDGYGMAPIGASVTITTPEQVQITVSANVTLSGSETIENVQAQAEVVLQEYIQTLQQTWGAMPVLGGNNSNIAIYLNAVLGRIVTIPGVLNAFDVKINGSASDLVLSNTPLLQKIPSFNAVVLTQS